MASPPPHTSKAVMSLEERHLLTSSQLLTPGDFADTMAVSKNVSLCAYLHSFGPLPRPRTRRAQRVCVCEHAVQKGGEHQSVKAACVRPGQLDWQCLHTPASSSHSPCAALPAPCSARACGTHGCRHEGCPRVPSAPPTCVPRAGASTCSRRLVGGTHATGSCPPPAWWVWVFSCLPLTFWTDHGERGQWQPGCSPCRSQKPGARSQTLPADTPGVLTWGLSWAHIFLILFPREGLKPCTQQCFAARSVKILGAEGLGTRMEGGRELGGCRTHQAAEMNWWRRRRSLGSACQVLFAITSVPVFASSLGLGVSPSELHLGG